VHFSFLFGDFIAQYFIYPQPHPQSEELADGASCIPTQVGMYFEVGRKTEDTATPAILEH
jgi:hypothetical protein